MAFIGYLGMFYGPLQAMSRLMILPGPLPPRADLEVLDAKPEVVESPHPAHRED